MVWEWTSSTGMINIVSAAVAVNETVAQAGFAIETSFSVHMVREITINRWPRKYMGRGMASTCLDHLGPDHPSPCLQTCPSESFYTPSGPSAQACALFTSRVCARWNSRPRSPHLSGLHSSCIRSIPDLDCTSIEFLLHGWSRRKFRTSTTTRREFLRDRFTFRHRLY
jgi:hypothetical protein